MCVWYMFVHVHTCPCVYSCGCMHAPVRGQPLVLGPYLPPCLRQWCTPGLLATELLGILLSPSPHFSTGALGLQMHAAMSGFMWLVGICKHFTHISSVITLWHFIFYYVLSVYAHVCQCVTLGGQLLGIGSFPQLCRSWGYNWSCQTSGKPLYSLSGLADPLIFYFESIITLMGLNPELHGY